MTASLPLPTLLSQVVVAFIIEFDNEFEHRTPHRTTLDRSGTGTWLTLMVMWWNCMRFAREEGITVGELEDLARTQTNWNGMERWGYIVVAPDPGRHPAKVAAPRLGGARHGQRPQGSGDMGAAVRCY